MTLTKTEKKALETMTKGGFTFAADNIFRSFRSGQRVCKGLVAKGLATECHEDGGVCYRPTPEAKVVLADLVPRKPEPKAA